jgi:hypothetical protein
VTSHVTHRRVVPAGAGRADTGFWLIAAAFLTAMASTTLQTPLYPLYQREQGFATFVITVIFAGFVALGGSTDMSSRPRAPTLSDRTTPETKTSG